MSMWARSSRARGLTKKPEQPSQAAPGPSISERHEYFCGAKKQAQRYNDGSKLCATSYGVYSLCCA
jgi:hypothetical protein